MDSCKIPLREAKWILALGRKFLTLIYLYTINYNPWIYAIKGKSGWLSIFIYRTCSHCITIETGHLKV